MAPSKLVRAASLFVLLFATSFATAATTEFRVFFDTDRNPATGCTVGGMNGVEQVLVTQVTDSGNAARVTRTFRQLCTGSALGSILDDDTSGWDAALQSSTRELTFETRIRRSAFGPGGITRDMRLGFEATRTPAIHTALVNDDGSDVVLPESALRRRASRSPGGDRVIVLDGNLADWTGLDSEIYGMASGGTRDLRLLRVFSFEDVSGPPSEKFLYFAVIARIGSDAPFADDDVYTRQEGQSLSVPGPGVLANDGDPLGEDMDAVLVSEPKRGSVALNEEEGGFTYSPNNPQSKATDFFEYKVRAGTRESNIARVKIKVRDGEGNDPPSFTAGGNVTVPETSGLYSQTWATNISPGAGETQTVSFTVTNDNNGLFTIQPAIAPNGTLTFTPAPNQSGSAIVTVILTDSEGASTTPVTFIINVTNVNNPPNFTVGPNQVVAEDSGPQTVNPWATSISPGPADESGQSVSFTVTGNTNPALFSSGPSVSPTGVLTYTPAPNANGTATITLRLTDNGNPPASSSQKQFTITITPVNDNPSFTAGADPINVNEDSGAFSATWATNISAGPLEPSQTVSFTVTNNNNALFSAQPAIDPSGTLTFTPAANANGSALVSVTLFDNLGGSSAPAVTFTINVAAVNDVPSFVKGADIVVLDTAGAQAVAGWATALSAGPANESGQVLDFIVSNNNPTLFSVAPAIAPNGTLSFTPAPGQQGVATVTVQIHDNGGTANGGVDTSTAQTFTITIEKVPTITSGNTTTFLVGQPGTFSVTTTGLPRPSIAQTGALPTGVTFVDGTGANKGTGVLSGTPAAGTGGSYPITFQATNVHGSSAVQNFTLIVNEPAAITSANTATFTQGAAGSFTVTTTGFPLPGLTLTGAAVPAGLTFTDNGNGTATLSGTPTAGGGSYSGFTLTASNGVGANATQSFTIVINQTPVITSGNSTSFNATVAGSFTVTTTGFPTPALSQTGALPTGITFTDNGNGTATIGGTALQGTGGVYSIVITATNAGGSVQQNPFTITVCNVIAVTNPATTSGPAGSPFSQTFTQTGAVGSATFTLASGTLPTGLTLATTGVLSGTPTQGGTFPITVLVTDSNNCTGVSGTYNLVITCPTITVNNPANANGTANSAFSETFTQTGGVGTATFSLASGTLPTGLTLAANGVLSGTPTQTGSFPITVTATDSNGCTGTGATYTIVIGCQTITVNNPANANGTANSSFSETFTSTGAIGTATYTLASGTLPTGLTLAANGVLSGTPTQTGSFPITVTATDSNGCTGTSATYTIVIGCQTITVTNPANANGTANAAFSETFTQTGAIGTVTFTLASGTLPAGLTLAANGVLSGTPTQTGSFPITVTATDANGCTGTSATYTIVIACQTITVTNPATTTGTVNAAFSQTFTQTGAIGSATFTTASTLPAGLTLAANGVLSGTPTQTGSFPIVVTVTDGNGCTGTSSTYTLVIGCQTITVNNPANATGPAGSPFSETFTNTGAIPAATYTLASGTLPTGLTLATSGVLSGTPTQGGSFPITVTVTDANGCTGTGSTYTIVITCPTITVNNPANANGTANSAFSETFTQTGGQGTITYTLASGTLPAGLTLAANGVLSGTPTQTGSFPITVTATDANGCTGTGTTYTIVIACQTITVNNPANANGTANSAFSETFTNTGAIGSVTYTLASGTLPAGLTLAANGVLSGTPTQTGSFPITVTVTDANGCTGTGGTYTIVIACQTITVNNPANANGAANSAFSETFTNTGAIGTTTYALASGTLPAGLSLAANGTLSGTPTQAGSFPITVTATDANGCTGTGATYTIVIGCQTITVTNPANANGTAGSAFSETFTQSGAIGSATFTLGSGTLPAGLTLAANGVLSGTPTQTGSFPITVTVTDANGCTGTSATYTIVIGCQTITVTNPANATGPAGSPFSETFTQTGAIGSATFTLASGTLPTGLTLAANGVLSGTPTQSGSFPITVTVTDANGCTGTGGTYTIVITCPTITITNPGNANGTAGSAFTETFTQTGGQGTVTWTLATGTLPAGLTLGTNGTISGTPTQTGSFPISVTLTDANGCTGTSGGYTIVIACQTITVNNPATSTGTANAPFSQTFTAPAAIGTTTFTLASGTLPAGLTLATNGTLAGTPTQTGSFPITVTATDANGCTGTSATYTLVIGCQTITVTNPTTTTGTVNAAFSQTFTQSGAIGTATFTTASTLPAGLSLSTAGVLSGTPTQSGSFPIIVTVTDSNGCTGTGATYTLVIGCQTITVNNPANANGTVGSVFSETFTQSGAVGTATFTTASTLPAGITLSTAGVLSGTPTQAGNFPITVVVTDSNGCTGTSSTYTLVIVCQVITVTNPGTTTGTVDAAFSQTFTQTGAIGTATFTTASTLPSGLTLSTAGVLSGTPGQPGSFPIVVTVTDSNGCTGTSSTYTLVIACQTITVTNPATTNGTVDAAFSQTFTQVGVGTHTPIVWSVTGTLPSGLTLNTSTGVLSGTPGQPGSFPITVTATDANGCAGTGPTYTLVIACQVITVTNPATSTATFNAAFSQTFTQSGVGTHTPAVWSVTGTLPTGITLNTSTGVLSGTPTQTGTFPITVTVTDANGCAGTGATYTLSVAPVATNDSFSNGINNTQYVLTGGTTATPSTPSVQVAGTIEVNDLPSAATVTVTAGTFATSAGGSVTIAADGTFVYSAPAQPSTAALASDTFTYTVSSNTGGTGPVTSAPATVTVNLANRVWYVKNDSPAGGDGTSQAPFDTLVEAQNASTVNDFIYVYFGNGTTTGQNAGITLKGGQRLIGEGTALFVNTSTLVVAGTKPLVTSGGNTVVVTSAIPAVISGFNLSSTGGNAIDLTAAGAYSDSPTLTISNNTFGATAAEAIDINANATGTLGLSIITSNWVGTATGNGVDIRTTNGTLNLGLNTLTDVQATGTGVFVDGSGGGAINITVFNQFSINGNSGGGISVNTARFDQVVGGGFDVVNAGSTSIGTFPNPVGTTGMVLTNVTGNLNFSDLDIFNSAGVGLSLTSTGPANIAAGTGMQLVVAVDAGSVNSTVGPAVSVNNATVDLRFNNVSSANTTTSGVSLVNVSDSTVAAARFSAGATSSITTTAGATGPIFNVSGGNAGISYGGTLVNSSSTARAVSVSTWTSDDATDDMTFSGPITENGAGILFNGNSGVRTITFNGNLTISTGTGIGFSATSNTNTPGLQIMGTNVITSTSATALNVTNTIIGVNNMVFQRISSGNATAAADPASGIILLNTGSLGRLSVTGNGGACTSLATCGTQGGAIQNTTSHGISLSNTLNPSFVRMGIQNTSGSGIDGTLVTSFTLTNSFLDNNGTGGGADESNVAFDVQAAGTERNLSGAVSIANNILTNARFHGVRILNFNGTISDLQITGNTITSSTSVATSLGSGIHIQVLGSTTTVSNVTRGDIANNTITNFPSDAGIEVKGGNSTAGTGGTMGTPGSGTDIIDITGNFISGASAAIKMGTMFIDIGISGGNAGSRSQANFNISNNGTVGTPMSNSAGIGIGLGNTGYSTSTVTTNNNVLAPNNTVGSAGIGGGNGLVASSAETPDLTWTINNNNVSQSDGNGILAVARAINGIMDVKIQNNTVAAPLGGVRPGIRIDAGNNTVGEDAAVCLNISGNTSAGSGGTQGIGLRKQGAVATTNDFGINGLSPSPTGTPNVENHVNTLNPAGGGTLLISATSGFTSCSFP